MCYGTLREGCDIASRDGDATKLLDGHWEVGIAAAPASMSYPSRDSALVIAAAFSKAHGVDVWMAHDGAPFECIARSRADMKTADGANEVTPSSTTSAATIGGRR